MDLHETKLFGNSIYRWLVTSGSALLITILLRVLLGSVRKRLAQLAKSTDVAWDDALIHALSKVRFSLVATAVFCLAFSTLELSDDLSKLLNNIATLLLLIQTGISLSEGSRKYLDLKRQARIKTDPGSVGGFGAIRFVIDLVIWTVIALLALDNIGIDVTSLVTGLGVSGIAVALAVQNILGDLFASLTIVLDKPFIVGDFLKVGDLLGTVENIGLKTTRLRSLSGEQLVFSNADLLQSRIQNYGRLEVRRVAFMVGVTYQTKPEQLEAIPGIIEEAVSKHDKARFDRSHLANLGDFAIIFETVYYVDSPNFALYRDIQQGIYLHLARAFSERGIDFAYPTQTLYVHEERLETNPAAVLPAGG